MVRGTPECDNIRDISRLELGVSRCDSLPEMSAD